MNKETFLKELKNSDFDNSVASFMMFKELNGNGVGAGKMFENVLTWHINDNVNGWFALKLGLENSTWCVHDVIVSPNPNILANNDEFLKIKAEVEKRESDSSKRLELLHQLLNLKWGFVIGISAKTYKEYDGQLTTSNEPREILDNNVDFVVDGTFDVINFLDKLSNKTNNYQIILGLNTFKNGTYRLTNFDLTKLKSVVKSITFQKMRKHTRFFLNDSNDNRVVDFKYGGKTANSFQRGVWVCNKKGKKPFSGLLVFDAILEGNYTYKGSPQKWESQLKNLFVKSN
jgi:hypothetical protein